MQNYLLEHVAYDKNKYSIDFPLKDDEKIDKHVLLKIISKESNMAVAWICVATNLYLVAKKVKDKEATMLNGERLWSNESSEEKIEIDEWLTNIIDENIDR